MSGAVGIVGDALENLSTEGIDLEAGDKSDLVKKLMVITCSESAKWLNQFNIKSDLCVDVYKLIN